ncbi:MAG: S41 family peptidase [Acidobacteriota bacterium]
MRSRLIFVLISLLFVLPIVSGTVSARDLKGAGDDDSIFKHLAVFTEVLSLVQQAYVEPMEDEALILSALDGATDALDPFSIYVPADGVEEYAAAREVGSGHSGLYLLRERGVAYVVGVEKGSPADRAGLRIGDIVSQIQGLATRVTPLWEIHRMLAQKQGTQITLQVLRGQDQLTKNFVLETFEVPPVSFETLEEEGTGLLTLHEFSTNTADEVSEALTTARAANIDRLMIDLRGVPGGAAEVAYQVAGLLAEGDLGALTERGNAVVSFRGNEPRWSGERLVVLTNRGTLAAAEIFATILRQKLDASLVGERTFGYAGRLKRVDLSTGGHLWITDAFYTGPDASPLNDSLMPDVQVSDSRLHHGRAQGDGKMKDEIFDRALEVLTSDAPEEMTDAQAAA